MRLELSIEGMSRDEIVHALKTLAFRVESEQNEGLVRDENGNKKGEWLLTDWSDPSSILRFSAAHNLDITAKDITAGDGEECLIDGMDAQEWLELVLL